MYHTFQSRNIANPCSELFIPVESEEQEESNKETLQWFKELLTSVGISDKERHLDLTGTVYEPFVENRIHALTHQENILRY